jgi:hypothetical protein
MLVRRDNKYMAGDEDVRSHVLCCADEMRWQGFVFGVWNCGSVHALANEWKT